jgi:hypothetical protein
MITAELWPSTVCTCLTLAPPLDTDRATQEVHIGHPQSERLADPQGLGKGREARQSGFRPPRDPSVSDHPLTGQRGRRRARGTHREVIQVLEGIVSREPGTTSRDPRSPLWVGTRHDHAAGMAASVRRDQRHVSATYGRRCQVPSLC